MNLHQISTDSASTSTNSNILLQYQQTISIPQSQIVFGSYISQASSHISNTSINDMANLVASSTISGHGRSLTSSCPEDAVLELTTREEWDNSIASNGSTPLENVVWWDSKDDPENPINWSESQKWRIITIVSMVTFVTYVQPYRLFSSGLEGQF